MDLINQLQSKLTDIERTLTAFDRESFLADLPYVIIEDENVYKQIPSCASGVYFLTHHQKGLLYIGKAKSIRQRWAFNAYQEHDCLEPAICLENVKLTWWVIPAHMITIVEDMLIRLWNPKWNGQIKSHMRNDRDHDSELYQSNVEKFLKRTSP
jgi:hypothetical protein